MDKSSKPHCTPVRVSCKEGSDSWGWGWGLLQLPQPTQRPTQAQGLQPAPFQVRVGIGQRRSCHRHLPGAKTYKEN